MLEICFSFELYILSEIYPQLLYIYFQQKKHHSYTFILIRNVSERATLCYYIPVALCLLRQVQLSGTQGTDDRSDGTATEERIPRGIFRGMCCGQQNGLCCPRDIKRGIEKKEIHFRRLQPKSTVSQQQRCFI